MRALNFGSLNIDYVYSVAHTVKPGETLSAGSCSSFCGGKGLNQSVALARAGAEVFHAGSIGSDGEMLREKLDELGVNTDFISVTTGQSGHAIIQVSDDGQNAILVYGGANKTITEKQIDDVLANFNAGDFLFLQNEINSVEYLIRKAKSMGLTTVFNPSPFTPEILSLPLGSLSFIVVNETEANELTGKTSANDIISAFSEKYPGVNVLLTLGEDGSVCSFNGEIFRQPAFRVKAVDTTAAGDTFTGFFFAFLDRVGVLEALRVASAASALAVSRAGASDSVPTVDEVMSFLSTHE